MTIDVIIPAYNPGRFFAGMLASVLNQSHAGDYTVTIVDDGSTEDLPAVIDSFRSDKIAYHRLPKRMGAGYARNEAIRRTNGEMIVYQDADDLMCVDRLKLSVAEFEKDPSCVLVHGNVRWVIRGIPEEMPRFHKPREVELPTLLIDLPIWSGTAAFRRSALSVIGLFDESYEVAEDYDLWARFVKHFPDQIRYVHTEMVYHNRHAMPHSLSVQWMWTKRHEEILRKMRQKYRLV